MGYFIFGLIFIVLFSYLSWIAYKSKKVNRFLKIPIILMTGFMVVIGVVLLFARPSSDSASNEHNQPRKTNNSVSKSSSKSTAKKNRSLSQRAKTTSKSKRVTKVNNSLEKVLTQSQGFATGKLDKDGNPTNDGTPNDNFAWALYVQKIVFNKNRTFSVYMDPKFIDLSEDTKKSYAHSIQNISMSVDDLNASDSEVEDGLHTEFLVGQKIVGISSSGYNYSFPK